MKLEIIRNSPEKALHYLERYVNDGSPSGFTRPGQLGPDTDPFGISPWYHPYIITTKSENVEIFGQVPELPGCPRNGFLVHPDVAKHGDLINQNVGKLKSIKLVPTSSGRTGRIIDPLCDYYLKFHYPFVIGRFNRSLPRIKTLAGPEMSRLIERAILCNSLTPWLHILPEVGALVFHPLDKTADSSWGLIFRHASPVGPRSEEIRMTVPLFSLWSTDRLVSFDQTIIEQMVKIYGSNLSDIFLQRVLFPILDAYFGLITSAGLQIELNAQNILIGLNEEFLPVAVIFRDLNGIEKDLPIHKLLGLNTKYESSPYKEISNDTDFNNYVIRHSFSFDSKLTNYVILPLAAALEQAMQKRTNFLLGELRSHVSVWLSRLPQDYFPKENVWYTHEDIDLSQERPYVKKLNPILR